MRYISSLCLALMGSLFLACGTDNTEDPNQPQPGGACGGFAGTQCRDDEFCDYDANAACGEADGAGICKPRPEGCPDIFAPVCGCDGMTHPSACSAQAEGTDVRSDGECPQ